VPGAFSSCKSSHLGTHDGKSIAGHGRPAWKKTVSEAIKFRNIEAREKRKRNHASACESDCTPHARKGWLFVSPSSSSSPLKTRCFGCSAFLSQR
jgi:hypothetical protein